MRKFEDFGKRIEAVKGVPSKKIDFTRQQLAQQADGRTTSSADGYGIGK